MAERQSSTSSSSSRPSQRSRTSFRSSNPDIFSDDFALDPFEISNRYGSPSREGDGLDNVPSPTRPHDYTERSIAQQRLSESLLGFPRRSSGSQRYGGRNSLSSRRDTTSPLSFHTGGIAPVSDDLNGSSTPHRSISSTSTFTMPRTQSPYQGATGPSQPYGLYPQDIGISRTPSIATTSTVRMPERLYTGPVGPTQPYGMYPQNTVPEDEVSPVDGISPTPVGFPGLGQDYRRRFGPDGEEAADLVGPDGHTEQLPPYSRYANDLPPKAGPPTVPVAAVSPVSPVVAQGNHPEASQDTLIAAQSSSTETTSPTVEDSSTQLNPTPANAAQQLDESGNFKESPPEKRRRRVCWDRLPIWAVVLLLLVVGILIGAVIGGILGHKAGQEKATESIQSPAAVPQAAAPSTVFVTTTSLVDAVPVTATPSDLPPLPTGSFVLNLGTPSVTNNACLNNKSESSAWQCTNGTDLNIEITQPGCQFSLIGPTNAPIRYGAQPPQLLGPTKMQLMNDKGLLNKGPAFFFQQAFDKIVVVRESDFSATSMKRSFSENGEYDEFAALEDRDVSQYGPPALIATPPSRPWYCFWNGTMLEGFIFVQENTTLFNASTSASSHAPDQPPFASNSIPSITNMGSPAASSTPGSWPKRDISAPINLASFPKVVKIEERRNAQNPVQPYCQQMQILDNNTPGLLRDQAGQLIRVNLTENEPEQEKEMTHGPPSRRRSWHLRRDGPAEKRDMAGSNCECQWLSS